MKKQYIDAQHKPSLLPEGEWKLVWNDEFDGDKLDETKWDYRLNMMGKRHNTWQNDGVTLDGSSNAVFRIYEKDGQICSSQLQTGYNFADEPVQRTKFGTADLQWPIGKLHKNKFLHGFGYYECRCRMQNRKGWWSAFWLQSPMIGCFEDAAVAGVEIDIMESFEPGYMIPHFIHWGGYGLDHKAKSVTEHTDFAYADRYPYPSSVDGWHTFAVDWSEKGYDFYIDGVFDGHISAADAPISYQKQFILISTEVHGYRHEGHCPTEEAKAAAAAGDTFLVDYVRVFDRVR